jgi:hypothetical protein
MLSATLASSSSSLMLVGAVLILVGGAAAFFLTGGPAPLDVKRPPVAPFAAARGASKAASPATPVGSPRAAAGNPVDDRKVDGLIAQLNAPATAWGAAAVTATIQSPRAEKAPMAAYDRRDYAKMGGAASFPASGRPDTRTCWSTY